MIEVLRKIVSLSPFRTKRVQKEIAKCIPTIEPLTKDIYDVLVGPMPRSSVGIVHDFEDGSQKVYDPVRIAAAEEIKRLRIMCEGMIADRNRSREMHRRAQIAEGSARAVKNVIESWRPYLKDSIVHRALEADILQATKKCGHKIDDRTGRSPIVIAVDEERAFLSDAAVRYASHYPLNSDGRNTFMLFSEMIDLRMDEPR